MLDNQKYKKRRKYFLLIGTISIIYIVLYLNMISAVKLLETFNDSRDYITLRNLSILELNFWKRALGIRPFTIPIIFKILGDNHRIVIGQIILYLFSWIALAIAFALTINKYWLKILSFLIILMFSMSTNLFFWPKAILSESIYISLFALSLSALLSLDTLLDRYRAYEIKIILLVAAVCILLILASQTRDASMYVTMCFLLPLGVLTSKAVYQKDYLKFVIYIFLIIIIIENSLIQYTLYSKISYRSKAHLINVISQRILPYPNRRGWFIKNGMPISDEILNFAGKWASECNWSAFGDFIGEKGGRVYIKFLLNNPVYTIKSLIDYRADIVNSSIYWYTYSSRQNPIQRIIDRIIWVDGEKIFILYGIMFVLNILMVANSGKNNTWISFMLLVSVILLSIICFHGDAIEVERHCLPVQLNIRLGIIFGIFIFVDNYLCNKIRRLKQ